jgi:hypothetical protein
MSEQNGVDTMKGWFAGRLPDGWFTGVEVTVEGDQIVVVGKLPVAKTEASASTAYKEGAAAGRIARFREETRGHRIHIAREAEARFDKLVTWGAASGSVTERFTPGGSGRGERSEKAKEVMIGWRRAWRGGRRPRNRQVF